jgi:tetratricopeptide (TPR) repeat protein
MFQPPSPDAALNLSNVQRSAMLTAGLLMGADRPLLGWGPGATPLIFPRYRAGLEGGAENVLQLHSVPAQLWAELGALGIACALAFGVLVVRNARREPTAALALAGYGVLALTDWQLDVPVFSFATAASAALLATPGRCHLIDDIGGRRARHLRWAVGGVALVALALIALLGRPEPTPEMNVRALALARDPAQADRAIALLRGSLALDPAQEIANFNLGWLLVLRDPAAAEKNFLSAAHLVPDKGGVYFGLGLSRLNQNHPASAARAFALECLNDPAFLASPWWREPGIAAQRDATAAAFAELVAFARTRVPHGGWHDARLAELAARAASLGREGSGQVGVLHRERTGYPVLMRDLDLPPPLDVYEVREFSAPPTVANPPKGWLPSPLLIELLDAPAFANPKSKIENPK